MVFLLIALSRLQGFLAHWREISSNALSSKKIWVAANWSQPKTLGLFDLRRSMLGKLGDVCTSCDPIATDHAYSCCVVPEDNGRFKGALA